MKRTLLIVAALVLFTAAAAAQNTPRSPEALGYSAITITLGPSDESIYTGSAGLIEKSTEYGALADYAKDTTLAGVRDSINRLLDGLTKSKTFAPGTDNGPLIRVSLTKELLAYRAHLEALTLVSGDLSNPFVGKALIPPQDLSDVGPNDVFADQIFFEGTDTQVILRRFPVVTVDGVKMRGDPTYYANVHQATEFRAILQRVDQFVGKLRAEELVRETQVLSQINNGWRNYLEHGFAQYPWEAYVNGYITPKFFGGSSWYDPPEHQIVFMHPELGILADLRRASDASANETLLIHTLGYIHYFEAERDWFLGGSLTVSLSDSDFGLGVGPTLHFGNSARGSSLPNVSVGVLWQQFDDGPTEPVLGLSIDLWRLFDEEGPEGVFRAAMPSLAR